MKRGGRGGLSTLPSGNGYGKADYRVWCLIGHSRNLPKEIVHQALQFRFKLSQTKRRKRNEVFYDCGTLQVNDC